MFGRMDTGLKGTCKNCDGSKKNPKKRKEKCPECSGTGMEYVCLSCGEKMPCSGTEDWLDQTWCSREK